MYDLKNRWVNESYGESCLEVAEELANQTPVRLDLLLSLLPPDSGDAGVVDNKMDTYQVNQSFVNFVIRVSNLL